MKAAHTFLERQKVVNHGEILFEKYCTQKNYKYWRLGFEEKVSAIPNYFKLNPLLRNIPDYILETPNGMYVVNVKGTGNFKKEEIDKIPLFLEWYNTKEFSLVYVFCFAEKKPIMVYPEKVIQLYQEAGIDKQWQDGKIYRSLNFSK
jgi:hypothetical protein